MTPGARRLLGMVALVLGLSILGGCAAMKVEPWDRDLLAQPQMSFDPYPMLSAVDDHIYFSTEGSTGGQEAAGGGCGCN